MGCTWVDGEHQLDRLTVDSAEMEFPCHSLMTFNLTECTKLALEVPRVHPHSPASCATQVN